MRSIVFALVVVVLLVLLIHGVGMARHHDDAGCATCVTVILLVGALAALLLGPTVAAVGTPLIQEQRSVRAEQPERSPRPPPKAGTVLRL
jgi:hypothetical protein